MRDAAAVPANAEPPAKEREVRIPDVREQPFVFAKGIIDDAGLEWQVIGRVQGFAANLVASQEPAPGAVVTSGDGPVLLKLRRNADYPELGLPHDASDQAMALPRREPSIGPQSSELPGASGLDARPDEAAKEERDAHHQGEAPTPGARNGAAGTKGGTAHELPPNWDDPGW